MSPDGLELEERIVIADDMEIYREVMCGLEKLANLLSRDGLTSIMIMDLFTFMCVQ